MAKKKQTPPIQQTAIGDGNVQVAGDNNTVNLNQTFVQKFINVFRNDAETVEQRNRRIMLGHVENFWVKGVLEKSLHGIALLELGITEDPSALNYPWAIKRESTKVNLPSGTSMLEIFHEIGMGRSLLILGAPGSGKTTMSLELTRQLIERARIDESEPVPVVFNLSSWTERTSLRDWLIKELNIIYTIPKKTATSWITENKMLLILDGLDEVRQEDRNKCVNAINLFRQENGLTSIVVCSRVQDYAELKAKLSFDGAIEIQPLTSKQVDDYFKRFGKGLSGVSQALKKDASLREMAENPLFLSIMSLAYREKQGKEILISGDIETRHQHLLDTYIEYMFEHSKSNNVYFNKQDVLHWTSWLAGRMLENTETIFHLENLRRNWLESQIQQTIHKVFFLGFLFLNSIAVAWVIGIRTRVFELGVSISTIQLLFQLYAFYKNSSIFESPVEIIRWSWKNYLPKIKNRKWWIENLSVLYLSSCALVVAWSYLGQNSAVRYFVTLIFLMLFFDGVSVSEIATRTTVNQGIKATIKNIFTVSLIAWVGFGLASNKFDSYLLLGVISMIAPIFGGMSVFSHYLLRLLLYWNRYIPLNFISFLNYATDLIFLRRIGGGYIFVHRLLMEHFASMYRKI